MRKSTLLVLSALMMFVFACSVDSTGDNEINNANLFTVKEAKSDNPPSREEEECPIAESCLCVKLIAGQNNDAGWVTADVTEDQIVITYITNGDWTIDATHLSIGECEEIPVTGADNPKIGHFEHSSEHDTGVNEVVYTFPIEYLVEDFCFAAHAEVSGPTGGETAWAQGTAFEGNSWAMYVDALLNQCDGGGGDPPGPVVK